MNKLIAMVAVLLLVTGCVAHKHVARSLQVVNKDSGIVTTTTSMITTTDIACIDTTILIAADTLEYEWPIAMLYEDSIIGNIFPADGLVINTPSAKAKITKVGDVVKTKIWLPPKLVPVHQYKYHSTTAKLDSNTVVRVVENTNKKDVVIDKKKNPVQQILAIGILILLLLFLVNLIKKIFI
jgi:hypothetical protein